MRTFWVPGGDYAATGTIHVASVVSGEARGEENMRFERVKVLKLALLDADDIRASIRDSVTDKNTLIVVSETLHVPRDNRYTLGGYSTHP